MGLIVNFSDFENISATGLNLTDYVIGYRSGPNREMRATVEEFFNYLQSVSSNIVYAAVSPNSANWNGTYTSVAANSALWDSTYTTVNSLSDSWEESAIIAPLQAASASWNSTYTTVNSLSDSWEESAIIAPLQAASASWNSTYTSVATNSASWNSTYTTVNSLSDSWEESAIIAPLQAASASWNSTYTTVNFMSANNASVYTTVNANSGKYESTYTSLNTNSAKYESTYNNVSTLSGNGTFNLYARGINLASTVAWTSAVNIPTNINELTGGGACLTTDIACIIKSRTLSPSNIGTTGVLFSTPPSFGFEDTSGNSHASSLSIGTKPLSGNYSRTSNGVGIGNSNGKFTYNGGAARIVSTTLPVFLTANLSLSVNNITTSLPLTSANTNFSGNDFHVKVDNEIMYVSSGGSASTMTVARGQLGTTAADHLSGALVTANVGLSSMLLIDACFTMKRFESF